MTERTLRFTGFSMPSERKSTIHDVPFLRCDVPYLPLCDVRS